MGEVRHCDAVARRRAKAMKLTKPATRKKSVVPATQVRNALWHGRAVRVTLLPCGMVRVPGVPHPVEPDRLG